MTITVEIPSDIEGQIQEHVARGDTESMRYLLLEAIVPTIEETFLSNLRMQPKPNQAKTLADLLEGYVGVISSSDYVPGGAQLSTDHSKRFADLLQEKHGRK